MFNVAMIVIMRHINRKKNFKKYVEKYFIKKYKNKNFMPAGEKQ